MIKFILLLLLLVSCASNPLLEDNGLKVGQSYRYYEFTDHTGTYLLKRELKLTRNLITRSTVYTRDGMQELEKQVSVSKIGSVKLDRGSVRAVLPSAAEFEVWYNKKQYNSQQKITIESRKLNVKYDDPDGTKMSREYNIPKGNYFCYFSQLPECLKLQNLLVKAAKKSIQLFVIWDNFPYHVEQYDGLINRPMILSTLSLSDHTSEELKYSLDIGNQIIFYHFDKKLNFDKMFWISQGVSLVSISKE